jgi:Raf kinase inhibitor-like YbhB/YbcL family protein
MMTPARSLVTAAAAMLLIAGVALLPGCKRQEPPPAVGERPTQGERPMERPEERPMTMKITSPAFTHGSPIPARYTGDGQDASPPLTWSGVPAGAVELALICDDPDAPRAEPWVHWVLYKIPASATGLAEGIPGKETLSAPAGAMQGLNTWPVVGYRGPAPPHGHGVHHYRFHLYALDAALTLQPRLTKAELLQAIKGHVLAEAELVGTYQR